MLQRRRTQGLTLVELLVVLAIIAALAGIIYPAVMQSIAKSQAALAVQRVDAIERAKTQFLLDNPGASNITPAQISSYLTQFGQQVDITKISDGTGGTINLGDLENTAYFQPTNPSATFQYALQLYRVPTAPKPEAPPPAATPAG